MFGLSLPRIETVLLAASALLVPLGLLVPWRQSAPLPTALDALVPGVLAGAGVALGRTGRLPRLCLASASITWVLAGLSGSLPSAVEPLVQRLAPIPLVMVAFLLLSLPHGNLRGGRLGCVAAVAAVAGLAMVGVGALYLAVLGCLLVAGGLTAPRDGRASLSMVAFGGGLFLLDKSVLGSNLAPRTAADGVGLWLVTAAVVGTVILTRPLLVLVTDAQHESGSDFGRRLGAAMGTGPVDLYFTLSPADGRLVDIEGNLVPAARAAVSVHNDAGTLVALLTPPVEIEGSLRGPLTALIDGGGVIARLRHEQRVLADELASSRRRLVTAADQERARLQRQLERTVLRRLSALAEELASAPPVVVDRLADARRELARLASGLDPLAGTTLSAALHQLSDRNPALVRTDVDMASEPADDVARVMWFLASEAVANAMKHAPDAPVVVRVRGTEEGFTVQVVDQGAGGADAQGSGLLGIADRVRTAGGRFSVTSGRPGTRVEAVFGLDVAGRHPGIPVVRSRSGPDPLDTRSFLDSAT